MLIIVPARRGSKGIPGKNTKPFRGFALIEWSLSAALFLADALKARVVCSTDDPGIKSLVQQRYAGRVTLHERAEDLANDTAGMAEVVLDVCAALHATRYVLLQPTSPLRLLSDLRALARASQHHDTAVSCSRPYEHPEDLIILDGPHGHPAISADKTNRRQDRKTQYRFVDGAYYAGTVQTLRDTGSFLPKEAHFHTLGVPAGVDIDTPFDWAMAEAQHDWLQNEGYEFVRPTR
ncbi:MAG: hypothetical protein CSA68_10455 [Rhodobacterales bacterium]|nr:MAG: hypothetical protein CSA68_10455 [Rhodobacterales bacterium]